MKIIPILLLAALSFQSCKKEKTSENSIPNPANNKTVETPAVSNKIVIESKEDIQKYYAEYQNELDKKSLDSASFKYECDGREGIVTYFSKDSQLMVIRNQYSEYSHYSAVENYFLNEDKPFFILKDETVWQFDGGNAENPETKDDVTESRIYLVKNKVIDCLEKKYTIRSVEKSQPDVSKIPNQASKNCKSAELLSEFEKLIKHKNYKKERRQCL
ncbi:hypothetical protein [Chryseobacterium foetidum]|uniref:hypothetical protein n=1 Tax=Chryseobacterium foetidum TaxID=2951057 RepID=UPI0021C610E1|nr:hypothetical protein [Chryseobacterium foetidum]